MSSHKRNKRNNFFAVIFLIMVLSFIVLKIFEWRYHRGSVKIGEQKFSVQVLRKPWELEQGLSGKASLPKEKGYLFVFTRADKYDFWMKGMRFPIDIIWINDGKIVYMKERAPVPITNFLETYISDEPAQYVLEINAGLAEKYGFKVGDRVQLDI